MKAYYWVVSWTAYGLGHIISKCMNTKYTAWMYPAYNWLMTISVINNKGIGPWKNKEY